MHTSPISREALAQLRGQSLLSRKLAVTLRPRSLPELLVAAKYFRIDLATQPQLVWLADLALAIDWLPACWEQLPSDKRTPMLPEDELVLRGIPAREVMRLPALQRVWYMASTGDEPPQYAHQFCSLVTERHPIDGFVAFSWNSSETQNVVKMASQDLHRLIWRMKKCNKRRVCPSWSAPVELWLCTLEIAIDFKSG